MHACISDERTLLSVAEQKHQVAHYNKCLAEGQILSGHCIADMGPTNYMGTMHCEPILAANALLPSRFILFS